MLLSLCPVSWLSFNLVNLFLICFMRKVWYHQIWFQNYLGFIVSDLLYIHLENLLRFVWNHAKNFLRKLTYKLYLLQMVASSQRVFLHRFHFAKEGTDLTLDWTLVLNFYFTVGVTVFVYRSRALKSRGSYGNSALFLKRSQYISLDLYVLRKSQKAQCSS